MFPIFDEVKLSVLWEFKCILKIEKLNDNAFKAKSDRRRLTGTNTSFTNLLVCDAATVARQFHNFSSRVIRSFITIEIVSVQLQRNQIHTQ